MIRSTRSVKQETAVGGEVCWVYEEFLPIPLSKYMMNDVQCTVLLIGTIQVSMNEFGFSSFPCTASPKDLVPQKPSCFLLPKRPELGFAQWFPRVDLWNTTEHGLRCSAPPLSQKTPSKAATTTARKGRPERNRTRGNHVTSSSSVFFRNVPLTGPRPIAMRCDAPAVCVWLRPINWQKKTGGGFE